MTFHPIYGRKSREFETVKEVVLYDIGYSRYQAGLLLPEGASKETRIGWVDAHEDAAEKEVMTFSQYLERRLRSREMACVTPTSILERAS